MASSLTNFASSFTNFVAVTAQEMFEPGMVFDPTDEELVFHYLTGKVSGCTESEGFHFIKDIDLYQHEPSQLSSLAQDSGQKKKYFFTPLHKKCQKGKTAARQVPGGFWKKTGEISYFNGKDGKLIAKKTSLAYCNKDQTSESVKGQWLMKEYMFLENEPPNQNDEETMMLTPWTLCVIYHYKRHRKSKKRADADDN